VRTNQDIERLVDTSDTWIRERTGISERRLATEGITTSEMGAHAAAAALDMAGVRAAELDLIVVATVTADMPMPSAAALVQHKIGADTVTHDDGRPRGVLSTSLSTDGSLVPALHIPGGGSAHPPSALTVAQGLHFIRMNGQEVFKHAVKNLVQASRAALEEAGMTALGIDWVVAHQANKRILDQVALRLEIGPDRMLSNIDRVGNTSSASIPILLDERVRAGTIKPGDAVLMSALGAGVSWGGAVVRM
jgi:3-oxoacyl-[acyl-carrier-protein] synthase-3